MGEGGHWHPLLTAGPQQLVQDGQSVQAYLENQVREEEEDAGPQQSFEDAAGVTCDTRAELSPSIQGHPSRDPAPSGRAGKGALCPGIPGLCPRVRIPPGLCPHCSPSTARGHPKSQSPGPPSMSLQHPPGTSLALLCWDHTGVHSASPSLLEHPVGGLQGSPPLQTPSALPAAAAVPPSHPALRALCPFSWPGVRWAASPPQLRAGLGAAPGQQLSLVCFFL